MKAHLTLVVLTVALVTAVSPAPGAAAAEDEITVSSQQDLTPRLAEYTLHSPSLEREVTVRVQVPTGYNESPDTGWPMALLLHGRSENGTTWSDQTDLEAFDDMIIVTPDGGRVGWYTDWFDDSCCDPQRWETFHIQELLPWVDATFRVAPGRSQRFVAGDSMGGFGAMSYAARHPDLFGGAAELSGFVDIMLLETSGVIGVDGQTFQVAGTMPGSIFGPKQTEEVRWRGHNPVDLATNLAWTDLVLRHGNGLPGQFGGNPDAGEAAIRLTGVSFHDQLDDLGIEHLWDDYGNGVHTWPYWAWGLQITWPRWQAIAAAADPLVDQPPAFSYRSIEPSWSVYGWDVAFERPVIEFASFDDVTPAGFALRGSGRATVTTPGIYAPAATYALTVNGADAGSVVADRDGRLLIAVDLGPAHTSQQFTPAADAQEALLGDSYFSSNVVTISPTIAPSQPPVETTPPSAPALPATGAGWAGLGLITFLAGARVRRAG